MMYDLQKLIAIFIFVLASLLSITQFMRAYQFKRSQQMVILPVPSMDIKSNLHLQENSPLFKTALFGTYLPNDMATIKQSMLDVKLVGLMVANNEQESQVIIQTANGLDKVYLVGDRLPGGAIIKRIHDTGIVILYKGALESLTLPKNELTFEAPAKPLKDEND